MKHCIGILLAVWAGLAAAEVRFSPLNVREVQGVVGVTHDELLEAIRKEDAALRADLMPNPTDPTFSNAVLAVGLNIDTNSVAQINAILNDLGGVPIEGTATTVGGLLAALAAAVAWLKKRAAHLGSDGTADDAFATDLLGKQVAITAVNSLIDTKVAPANADLETALNGEGN